MAAAIKITKASGAVEDFNKEKLRSSLIRSGAGKDQAEEIIERVLHDIEPYTGTKEIYRLAKKYLKRFNHASGIRYSLKRALFRLGPTGYPFERYFGELLKHYGYRIEVGKIIQGRCVQHEVDVFAVKDNEVSTIECKYHNSTGRATDVKVAMYVHARFQDIEPVISSKEPGKSYKGWLVTNTRCTTEAIRYADCSKFKVVSWGYPQESSLERMIEDKRLYPVTIVSGIKAGLTRKLVEQGVVLLQDLAAMEVSEIISRLSLPEKKARLLKDQADALCLC